jgi:pimeloyl-ACP methyl ester carboxylesterase
VIDADLVLIHGFWSSPATWHRIVERLEADEDLQGLRIHLFGYESPKVRWPGSPARIPDYDDIAQSVPAFLSTRTRTPSPLVFVTHSQGGLILQRYLAWMLSEGRGRELARVRAIALLACPNEGSEYLASIRAVTGFNRHPQAGQLTVLERDVGAARRIVLRQIVNASSVDERQCPIPFHVYSGRTDNVVLRQSAQAVFPAVGVLPGDHFSILDPDSPGSLTVDTIKRHVLEATAAGGAHNGVASAPRPVDERSLMVRIDDCATLVRRDGARTVTFGTVRTEAGDNAYAEGVDLRVTLENHGGAPVYVLRVDLVVVAHDPRFVASYAQITRTAFHYEVPRSDLPPVRLDDLADLDGRVGLDVGHLMLEPSGRVGAHHSLRAAVVAAAPGLWRLAVVARYVVDGDPERVLEAASGELVIAKR